MKKYIIKNADGSEQSVMQAVHLSRKAAGETLMEYICDHNEDLGVGDDDYLTPFDFDLEEVECKEVNEEITDFESARKALGLEPNDGLTVTQRLVGGGIISLKDVAHLVDDINPKHLDALIALNKLFTIAQAWNQEDGFVPDASNDAQVKYYPYFLYTKDAAKYLVVGVTSTVACDALCLNRICFKSEKRAKQFGEQFTDLFNEVFF